ncbi:MAG: transporter substrate-binding domain-containing protein, partial [Oscillospiraceae bacterium]|nr:transporter substrate-binding domain-containing protein [Oscillospiraceae bacterium]
LLCAVFATVACASEFEVCADDLSEIGIFKGTDKGYELDREPTRLEAGVMLVKLLGGEEEALSLSYTAPFSDVPDWGKPYVQYLYDKGLTKGMSETEFGASDLCTTEQYVTFLLRVLGYTEGEDGDFEYGDDARWLAEEIRLLDGANYPWEGFYRDNMVAITYTALALPVKPLTATSDEVILLEKLVDEEKIKGAEKLLSKFRDYRMLNKMFLDFDEAERVSATFVMEGFGEDEEGYRKTRQEISYVLEKNIENPNSNRLSVDAKTRNETKIKGEAPEIEESSGKLYYKDGYAYANADGKKEKRKGSFADVETMLPGSFGFDSVYLSEFAVVEKSEEPGGILIYVIDIDGTITTVKIRDGKLLSVKTVNEFEGGLISVSLENIKTDGTVIVRYPGDFHRYEDVTPEPAGLGDLEKVRKTGELLIGITMFEPLNFLDEETEELIGFETDFAREVCKRLGVEPVFIEMDWSDKEYSLESGEIDCIWNGLTITDERRENMAISEPYMMNFLSTFVRKKDLNRYSKSAEGAKIIDSEWRFFAGDMEYDYFKGNANITGGESYID